MSDEQKMVLSSDLKPFTMEFTLAEVDPAVLGILTGGVMGSPPEPTFAIEVHAPIKRTFWQWLRRKPRQWTRTYIPNATVSRNQTGDE